MCCLNVVPNRRVYGSVFRDINIGKGRLQDEGDPLSLASSAVLVLCLNLGRNKRLLSIGWIAYFATTLPELYVTMCSNR
jgi:hypothetical protein